MTSSHPNLTAVEKCYHRLRLLPFLLMVIANPFSVQVLEIWDACKKIYRVKYTNSPYGFPKFWICSLTFQKYKDGPGGLHVVTHLVPNFCQKYMDGSCGLHFVMHLLPNLDHLKG
ncbi:hypothetical protein Hanom_Chr00s000005g01612161 [Helianthus anomalus]